MCLWDAGVGHSMVLQSVPLQRILSSCEWRGQGMAAIFGASSQCTPIGGREPFLGQDPPWAGAGSLPKMWANPPISRDETILLRGSIKLFKGAGKWKLISRTIFLASYPPPPSRYSMDRPLSNPLPGIP